MHGPAGLRGGLPFSAAHPFIRSTQFWIVLTLAIIGVILVALFVGSVVRIINYSVDADREITVPPADFERLDSFNEKPIIMPESSSVAPGNSESNESEASVSIDTQTTGQDVTSGSVTINGETTQIDENGSFRKSFVTQDLGDNSNVDLTITTETSGISDSHLDVNIKSDTEAEVNARQRQGWLFDL